MIPRTTAVFFLALLAGCATPARRPVPVAEPAPCSDSTYVQLKRQHPDSVSERGWQRLQSLDRDCAATRAESSYRGTSATMDAGHHGGRRIWLGAVVTMVAMMFAMR